MEISKYEDEHPQFKFPNLKELLEDIQFYPKIYTELEVMFCLLHF